MKPAPFTYRRVHTPQEAVAALSEARSRGGDGSGSGARVLAGGQSLILDMNFRRARPDMLVDINPITELNRIDTTGDAIHVGALTRHSAFEPQPSSGAPPIPGPLGRLLARVSRHIAHPPIRAWGTMVGSLAYAHPAAEWGAVAAALGAEMRLLGPSGHRIVPAEDFFQGAFTTPCGRDELLTEVRLPLLPADTGVGFIEQRRTHASFAMVAAVATLTVRDGTIADAKVGLANAADRPLRAHAAEHALIEAPPSPSTFSAAAEAAVPNAVDAGPAPADPHCGNTYRRHLVRELTLRTLHQAHQNLQETREP